MANVRYMGGRSATLGTKEITENGIYDASSDGLDGYSSVTVDTPAPSGSVSLEYTGNGQYSEDVSQYASAEITVDVPIPTVNTQNKSITATTSQQTVTPDPGYFLEQVTVNPQQNTATYTPAANTPNNDMGTVNNYRYVNTSGMVSPAGVKSISIESNGTYTEDITNNKYVDIDVNVPVSGDLGTKTIITNGTYKALDDNLDGYSEVTVNVPQNATLGIKTITNNGNYNAITDGYDGYSRVDVNVAGATLQTSKSVTATTSQLTVTPDVGYDGMEQVIVDPQVHTQTYTPADNTAANDMGVNNDYRYVDTSGMRTTADITPSNSNIPVLSANNAVNPLGPGLAIASYDNVTPSSTPTSVSTGDIIRIGGNGVIVDSIPTPTSLTPSNATPATITNGNTYTATANGYAIESYTNLSPSVGVIQNINNGSIYKATANGKAVDQIYTVTSSDIVPINIVPGPVFTSTNSGYLYMTEKKIKTGSQTTTAGTIYTINCGFQPKKIFIYAYNGANSYMAGAYDVDVNSTYYFAGWRQSSSSASAGKYDVSSSTSNGSITEVNSTGFKWKGSSAYNNMHYVAIG